jgi:predicted DNA-binding antitoxin AbrB/MazE fold protein
MSQEFHAIYEHGILRPLTPLDLPEAAEVAITVRLATPNARVSAEELEQQQLALNAMFDDVARLPQTPRNDGLSGRDHDRILYGSSK